MSKGDYALEQEKYSAELIEKANNEKDGLLKLAKDMATKELESYNEDKRREYDNKVTELNVNEKFIEEIENIEQRIGGNLTQRVYLHLQRVGLYPQLLQRPLRPRRPEGGCWQTSSLPPPAPPHSPVRGYPGSRPGTSRSPSRIRCLHTPWWPLRSGNPDG